MSPASRRSQLSAPQRGPARLRRRLAAVLSSTLAALALVLVPGAAVPQALGATACATTTTSSYTIQICLTAPAPGGTVSGNVTTTATGTITAGKGSIQRMVFNLDGAYLLTDYQSPYTFSLASARWVDGVHSLSASALMRDGTTTAAASESLTFANGTTSPYPGKTTPFSPSRGTAPASGAPLVVAALGDGAGGETTMTNVAGLVKSWSPNLFLYLGDVYEKGSPMEFFNWYQSGFGQFNAIADPVIGNHEYSNTSGGAGYFGYWGPNSDTYSFDAGGWHFIALNSNSQLTAAQWSSQLSWLQNDLAAHPNACTIAYWHHPLFNVGPEGPTARAQDFWTALANAHATLVLNGHDHDYQHWTALDASGVPSSTGLTELIAGGGGHSAQTVTGTDSRVVKTVSGTAAYGALKLSLTSTAASFQYVSQSGTVLDSGTVPCQGATGIATTGSISGTVTDAATGTAISGATVSTTGASTTTNASGAYTLSGLAAGSYQVSAAAGGYTSQTKSASVTAGATTTLGFALSAAATSGVFSDGFESGGLGAWTTSTGLTVQSGVVHSGSFAAEALTTSAAAYARKTLSATYAELHYRAYFFVRTLPSSTVNLIGDRTSAAGSLARIYLDSSGRLGLRNDVAATSTLSSTALAAGAWHSIELHLIVNGASSTTEAWLDGSPIAAFSSTTANLGTTPIGQLQLGENQTGRSYDVVFDDVAAGTSQVGP